MRPPCHDAAPTSCGYFLSCFQLRDFPCASHSMVVSRRRWRASSVFAAVTIPHTRGDARAEGVERIDSTTSGSPMDDATPVLENRLREIL